MNISITPYNIRMTSRANSTTNNQKSKAPQYQTNVLAQLQQDSVSFGASKKIKQAIIVPIENGIDVIKNLEESDMSGKIQYQMGMDINNESQPDLTRLLSELRKGLKSLVESNQNPDLPILRGNAGIHGRVKKAESIMQKVPPRKLRQKQEIFKMGDIIGVRIVLKSSSQKDFDLVFKSLGEMVKSNRLKVLEVENYRLTPKDSYVSQKTLNNFELTCHKAGQSPVITSKPRELGYTAVHITVEMPSGKLAEIQIMGRDMEKVKDIEDFFYKKRCNKPLDDKYKPIETLMNRVMGKTKIDRTTGKVSYEKLDDFQIETLDRYIKDSYAHSRAIPPKYSKKNDNGTEYFLPIPYSLPQELSFENLQKMKDICDYKYYNKKSQK